MLKIGHIADTHIALEHKRFGSLARVLSEVQRQMREERVDLIVHAGDLGESYPTGDDLDYQAFVLQGLASIAPTVVVLGNHDSEKHWKVLQRIETSHPLALVTMVSTLVLLSDGSLEDTGDIDPVDPDDVRCLVHCMPWMTKAQILARCNQAAPDATDATALGAFRALMTGMRSVRDVLGGEVPNLLVSHAEVAGYTTDAGQTNPQPGLRVSVQDLELCGSPIIALGHIHLRQEWNERIYYAGSPCRLTWGEAGAKSKGWNLYEFDDEGQAGITTLKIIPSPRLYTVEAEWSCEAETHPTNPDGFIDVPQFVYEGDHLVEADRIRDANVRPDDELRFRYHVAAEQREAAKAAVTDEIGRIWPGSIEKVTVEAVVEPGIHARAPEIAQVPTVQEQVAILLDREGKEFTASLQEKLETLLAGAQ